MNLKMIVLSRNASGGPCFHTCEVEATPEEYENGDHYGKAIENAEFNGYESPFEVFDENDEAAKQMFDIAKWLGADPLKGIRNELAAVIDMARSDIDDIESGLEDGTYEQSENADAPAKRLALEAIESFFHGQLLESPPQRYLLIMVGDVEPELSGPYEDSDAVLQAARNHRLDDGEMEDGLFQVTVRSNGVLEIDAFAGMDLEPEEEVS